MEFRCPDQRRILSAFAAMLCAGIDGIKNGIQASLDVDIYELSPEELAKIPSTPVLMDALKH